MNSEVLALFVHCDANMDDVEAWDSFRRELDRHGYEGPLVKFVEEYIDIHKRCTRMQSAYEVKMENAVRAWEPLISRGFALFTRWPSSHASVLHVGRMQNEGQWVTSSYPKGWQQSEVRSLCGITPGVAYLPTGDEVFPHHTSWTKRKTPYIGHERLPCKTCLRKVTTLPTRWNDLEPLTTEQVKRLWLLRKDM